MKRWYQAIAALLTPVLLYAGFIWITGNFHEVLPGELYRSAQISPRQIEAYQNRHGIKSIINLRGDNSGQPWYDSEIAAAGRLGIKHIDFKISAKRPLTKAQVVELIALMRDAPKPLLIHCHSGANRTSLAAALYLAAIKRRGEKAAEGQISLRYGHLPAWLWDSYGIDRTFENLEQDLLGWAPS